MKTMNKIQRLSITLMMMLMATATWAYTVTWTNLSGNPTISSKVGSTTIEPGTTPVTAGQTVTLTVAEHGSKYLTGLTVQSDVPATEASAPRRTSPSITIQGDVEVRQTGEFTYEFTMPIGNVTITPTFEDRTSISGAIVTLRDAANPSTTSTSGTITWGFDWLPHLPEVYQVVVSSTTLTPGTDYTVSSFSSITNVADSPQSITITGKGKYKDSKEVTYSITPRSISDASVQFSPTSFVYNHQNQAPDANDVQVYLKGQHLIEGTDYNNVSIPTDAINAGNYPITVTGIGNFNGTASNTYTITKMPISNCTFTESTSLTYNGSVQAPTITLNDGVGNLTENTHYTITYSTHEEEHPETNASKDVGSYTMTITAKDGTNYSGSKEITYSINSAGFAITAIADQTYTGAEITPTVEVKDGTNVLTFGTHYDVVYSNNINVGTARVSVVGLNSYNGKFGEVTFNITPKSVNAKTGNDDDITITLSETSFTYNTSTQKPTVTVKDGDTPLTENKDYTLVNAGGVNVGTYHATIRGLGNYDDQTTKNSEDYTINKLSLTGAEITLLTDKVTYDGTAQTPPIKQVKIGDVVIPSSDYDPDWANNTDAAAYDATIAPPTVTVKAKTLGTINLSDSETKKFTIEQKSIANVDITLVPASFTYKNGVTQKPTTVTVKDLERNATLTPVTDYTLTNNGGEAAGTYDVTVTGTGNYKGTAKKYYTISEQAGTTAITVADIDDLIYTGEAIKPTPTVQYTYEDDQSVSHTVTLTNDTHYTLSYENNVNVGTATVIVTLKGGYTGSTTKTFKIVARPLGAETTPEAVAAATVTSTSTTLVYNGNVQHATFTVVKKGRTLAEGVDYEVVYNDDATSAGTQNVTINGIGNYSGSVTGTYSIAKLSLNTAVIKLPATQFEYSRGAQTPTPVVSVGNFVIPSANYDVRWDNDADATNTADVTNIGTKTVYVTGKSNCDGSKSTDYVIVAKQIDASMVTLTNSVMTYTGSPLDPGVTVTDGSAVLSSDTEYTLTLTNNTKVGTATVKVTGQGNYTGVVQKTFTIQEKVHSDFTIADIAAVTYDGTAHQPTPNVKYSGTDLTLNTDYTLSYTNNVNAGTATVTVTGKGGYAGSTGTKTFTINPKTLTSAMVTLSNFTVTGTDPGFTYNGNNQKPTVTITDAAAPITADDYDITNAGGVDANDTNTPTYPVTITGKRNYTGTVNLTYKIYQRDISPASVTLNQLASYIYDGSAKVPGVRQVAFGEEVVSTTEYDVTHDNNTNAGTATVTVTGKKNYTGTTSATFTIQKKALTSNMITFDHDSFDYDGNNHAPVVTMKDMVGTTNIINQATDCDIDIPTGTSAVGTYTVTVDGQGNYTGTVSKQYQIVPEGSVAFDVKWVTEPNLVYNGNPQTPAVKVLKHNTTTELTTNDYDVAYSNNINAGTNTATVTVTGKGNYSGTQTKQFSIAQKPMTDAMVTLTGAPFTYNGSVQKPAVTVSDGSPSIISASDYTISNDGNINAGNYTVTVTATATGNYSGSGSQSYTINPYTLNATNTSVILDQSTFVYDRTAKQPNVLLVKVGDTMVVPTFTTAYSNNVDASNTATVTVTGSGNFTGAVDKTFVITPKSVTSDMIKFDKENFVYDGTVQKPTVTAKDGENTMTPGTDYTLTNEGGTNVGVYYAYIDGKGNYSGRASKPFYIITQNAAAFVVSDIADTEYDGTAKEPVITVTDNSTAPGTVLVKDENYTVSYLNNKDAGIATVIVTGMGSYAGTVTKNFNITPKPLAAEMISVSPGTFTFNGSLQRPDVTVTDGTIMKANDYTVINSGNVNQGTYYVTVIGQGNYKGTITNVAQTKYTITPLSIAEADVNLYELPSYVYDGTAKNPSVREVLVNNYVVPTTGYDVSYGTNIVAGPASITITGKGNFTGTKTVNFTIAQKEITSDMILLSNTEYIYTGELKKPEVTVKQGETTLTLDTDYTLSNNGGIYIGQYDVTVTGKGNYTGTASQTYNIIAQEAGSFVVTLSTESVVYTGGELKPAVTVKKGDVTLNEGTDYTVMYIDNINVGMAMVTVRGKGNYEGTVNKTFFITPKTLTGDMVTLSASSFTYNGVQQRPGVTVSDHDFLTSNDYYITNEGGVNIGSYNVIITGKSNYTGTVTKQFSITPLSLNDANIVLYEIASNIYDGKPKNPGVREVTVGTLVVPTTGYTTSVSPNINVGTVTVTVTGKDNFTGSAETTFVIMPKPLTSSMMTLTPTVFNYNGTVQKPSVTVKDGKVILTEDTDYTLTNEGGKEAGTYEVTVKGIGNYTDEATQSFIIVSSGANTFVVTLETTEYTFDGTEHKPNVTVKMEERTLSEGTDYTLTYSKNTNAGTALVTVKGIGDYTGEQVKTFTILPKALTDAMVTLDKTSFIYNEKVQKPEVTVADGTIMTADDYTVTNDGGTDEGTYQVVVTGQNNYKGVVIKSFTITREEIHGDDDPEHPDEKPITYTPTEEGSDEVKVSSLEGSETELEQITSVTIPATCTANGKTYSVVGVSANAFANVPNLTDIYLPDTEEPLEIAEDAIPTSVTVHTTLALLDDYALMPSLSENFKAGKIKTTVTAKNRYWTFSSGVDVYVPDGVSVYIARERSSATVTIVELSDNDLTVGGQRIIKHNNGVLISSEGNDTPYDLVACGRRMSSGSTITTDDFKDYGSQNCLVPVIVPTHFDKGYYFLRNNEFYSIQEEGEDVKVPAGKAVLYLHQAASSPSYSSVIQLVNTGEITNINGVERDADESDWYDMSGRKLNGRPTKKGVYIQNNKKIVIR